MQKTQIAMIGIAVAILAGSSTLVISTPLISGAGKKTIVHKVAWLQSFDDALVQSKATGKPVLLLSMFGKLDEEMPCANARTLRATLFKDPAFKQFAENEVVLAWEMVRNVPKVEIDLGDGKKIKRTLRGNAVMYLCNSDGKVLDAFPGVYSKEDFFPMIRESIKNLNAADDAKAIAWHLDIASKTPRTVRATMGKAASESTTLFALGAQPISGASIPEGPPLSPAEQAFRVAAAQLTDLSLTPMRANDVSIATLGRPLDKLTPEEAGQMILKADSQKNSTQVRNVIHLWLASEKKLPTPLEARDTVLETILKIPYKDPYFGLRDIVMPGTPN